MDDFQKFQAEAIEKIRERLAPNWEPPNSEKELPFNLSKADWQWLEGNVLLKLPCILEMSTEQLLDSFPKERGRTLIIRTFIWQCWHPTFCRVTHGYYGLPPTPCREPIYGRFVTIDRDDRLLSAKGQKSTLFRLFCPSCA